MAMKDPFRSHRSNVKKVKVVCSFKGKFQRCPPSGRLRYTGGETRIIWVERKIGFSALKSKILELLLCPNNDFPFCIIYQLQVKGNDAPLVMVSSDNDVRDMVSEYEKLKLLGKPTRLWIYVCNDNVYSYKQAKGNNISAKCVNIENCGSGFELSCQSSKRFGGKNDGFESNATTNIAAFISNNRAATVSAPSSQLIAGPQLQKHSVDMNSMPTGSDAKHELNSNHLARLSNLDRENIRPLSSNFNSVKTSFAPLSYSSQLVGSAYATKSSNGSHWAWNGLRSTIHNSRFNATDVRNQRICSCFICCHWNDPTETGNHRKLRLEGMPCVGKFCPGLHSISNISEQGQPIRLYYTGSWKPQSDDHDDTQDAKPVNATNISRSNGQLNSTNIMELECIGKPSDTELDAISFRNHCGIAHATGGLVSSGDLSFCNLPLSSYKEAEYLVHSSPTSKTVSEALAKLDIKLIDETNEEHLTRGPQVEVSNGDEYDSSYQEAAKLKKDEELKKEMQEGHPSSLRITNKKTDTKESVKSSQANGCITMDLGGFYSRLASKGLQTIKSSDIEYFKELGSGTYGTVFYGKWKGSDVAIKKLKSSCLAEGAAEQDRLLANFWKEAHILGQLRHPCVVAFYGVVTDGPLTNLATVTEYMVNGSLKQFLRRKDRTIDRRKRLIIAMDAAFGMEYLHEKKIVHFDLKSHNLLVNMKDTQRPVCKIGDLGLSKTRKRTMVSGGVRGTITWMAPELLNSKKDMVTEKVDVYSFGIVMWELLTGEEPYANMRPEKIIDGIIKGDLRPEIPSWCDPSWRSLMERCWSSDPASRPSFSKIAKELRTMAATMNIK